MSQCLRLISPPSAVCFAINQKKKSKRTGKSIEAVMDNMAAETRKLAPLKEKQ